MCPAKVTPARRRAEFRHAAGKRTAEAYATAGGAPKRTRNEDSNGQPVAWSAGTVTLSASGAGFDQGPAQKQKAEGTISKTFPGGFNHGLE